MNRTDRLQAILTHLQSKKVVKAKELANRFNLSLRTIYRDIRALEESGVPIGAEAGIGYFINDNYTLPPIALTSKEASALVFAAKILAKNSDRSLNSDFENALFKIKSVLKPAEKEVVENISNHVEVLGNYYCNNLYINEIQTAIIKHRIIRIKYQSLTSESPIEREVEAVGLCNYYSHWHLFAWCHLRSDYRDFRLDRIIELSITEKKCQKEDILSLEKFLEYKKPFDKEPNISFEVSENTHKYLENYKYYCGFVYEKKMGNDNYRMFFANDDYNAVAIMILNTGCMASAIQPQSLRDAIKQYVNSTYEFYKCTM